MQLGGGQSDKDINWYHVHIHSSVLFKLDLTVSDSGVSCTNGIEKGGVIVGICGLLCKSNSHQQQTWRSTVSWETISLAGVAFHVFGCHRCWAGGPVPHQKYLQFALVAAGGGFCCCCLAPSSRRLSVPPNEQAFPYLSPPITILGPITRNSHCMTLMQGFLENMVGFMTLGYIHSSIYATNVFLFFAIC